jgi:flagellar protein FliO/FliZ
MNSPRLSIVAPLGVLLYLVSTSILAAPPQTPPLPSSPVSLGGVLQVLFGLAIVLGTVAATAWLLKRLAPGQVSAGGAIKLIGGIAVGPKERVVVVEVGETWLVVGVAPGQVTALHNMPRIANLPENNALAGADQRFPVWLKDVMNRRNAVSGDK